MTDLERFCEDALKGYKEKLLLPRQHKTLFRDGYDQNLCGCAIGSAYLAKNNPVILNSVYDLVIKSQAFIKEEYQLSITEIYAFTDGFDGRSMVTYHVTEKEKAAYDAGKKLWQTVTQGV